MRIRLIIILCCMSMWLCAQYGQTRLFPDFTGNELLEEVVSEYKASILFFDYGTTRDTMFREVYAVNDSLECVYSGHKLYMDPAKDPTTTVFMNGDDNGINTEHTYPRSKGAGFGNARSDMHHLFPTRAMVNEERSNFPFGDIPDEATTKWFYKDQALIVKPTENLDNYSEWKWQIFEPRESFKGNVARAVMYFYTMYKTQADAEDPDFFWDMLPDLCEWHFADPVDSAEYVRTNLIAKWQQYPNPFVLDCSLASRSYCADIMDDDCELAVPVKEEFAASDLFSISYNSTRKTLAVTFTKETLAQMHMNIYDMNGRLLKNTVQSGYEKEYFLNVSELEVGTYIFQVVNQKQSQSLLFVVP